MPLVDWSTTKGEPGSGDLVLLLHGLDSTPESIQEVAEAIERELPGCRMLVPRLPLVWHRCVDLKELAGEVLTRLGEELERRRDARLFIVGHSAGGVLAQAVYLLSRRERRADGIDLTGARFVLIAPLNQGWEISHHLPLTKKLSWLLGQVLLVPIRWWVGLRGALPGRTPPEPWILQMRRSSPFLIWFRLAWLDLRARGETGPEVIQLLGSVDELVSWNDMVDAATGRDFVYFEVPYSDHVSIIDFQDRVRGPRRREIFTAALRDFEAARESEQSVVPWDTEPVPPEPDVRRVVFVIHGIRDEGHWTQKIASRARREYARRTGRPRGEVAVVTSSYGYFSMLQFLRYGQRRDKVKWLAERYVEARRRYPRAEFSFIGHSNGTYLVSHALETYPDIRFDRLAFAGSVVSTKFDWEKLPEDQFRYLLNFTATTDWVVGIFPRIADAIPLRWLLGPSLGGAGINGFPDSARVRTLSYRKGRHGAAIEESNWNQLARFAVIDEEELDWPIDKPDDYEEHYRSEQALPFRRRWGPVTSVGVWLAAVIVLLVLLPWLVWTRPTYVWIAPLLPLAAVVLAVAGAEELGRKAPLRLRKKRRKRVLAGLLLTIGIAYLGLLVGTPLLELLSSWNENSPEALRAVSVVAYFAVVYSVLTRV